MKKSLFILLAFALLGCACSTVNLVYRNADWYLVHKINGYTSFNDLQKATIRREVRDYMLWHRKVALPEYILFLQNLNGAVQYDGQLRAAQVAQLRGHLMDLYRTTLLPAIQPSADLLSGLNGAQIQELGRSFAEDIKQTRKEALTGSRDEILDLRADKTIAFMEWLAGDLSSEQEHSIRNMSRRLPVVRDIYLQQREGYQARLIALLHGHAGAEKIAAFLSAWMFDPKPARTTQQQLAIESFETASDEMIAQIQGMLTARQKEHVHGKISSYIEDMQSLSTEKHAASGASH